MLNKKWPRRGQQQQWAGEHEDDGNDKCILGTGKHESEGLDGRAIAFLSDEHSLRRLFFFLRITSPYPFVY